MTTPPPAPTSSPSPPSRWPAPYRAAIAFTMDNLGEAQAVHNNAWPHPPGTHPSVTDQLPRMLGLLARHGVRATYFAEAWSLGAYPGVVRDLARRGHEVGWHGWQHEVWSRFAAAGQDDEEGAAAERESFERSWAAAERAGVEYRGGGFRPPGGRVNERTWGLLRAFGAGYVSPAVARGTGAGSGEVAERGVGAWIGREGLVVLPFEWKTVDAFWYMEKFAELRREEGEREEVLGPTEFRVWLMGRIKEAVEKGEFLSVLFHPFLQTSEERLAVVEEVLRKISEDGRIWVAPCKEIAQWVRRNPELFTSGL
ncbi:hypothetical protein VTK26DRAFT_7830 [Humicola hyalothermophila]